MFCPCVCFSLLFSGGFASKQGQGVVTTTAFFLIVFLKGERNSRRDFFEVKKESLLDFLSPLRKTSKQKKSLLFSGGFASKQVRGPVGIVCTRYDPKRTTGDRETKSLTPLRGCQIKNSDVCCFTVSFMFSPRIFSQFSQCENFGNQTPLLNQTPVEKLRKNARF